MQSPDKVVLRNIFDAHVHLRDGEKLKRVIEYTAKYCRWATVMSNLVPPVLTDADVIRYRDEILRAADECGAEAFEPVMTIQITPTTTAKDIIAARRAGAIAGKTYPQHVTTNSQFGVYDYLERIPIYQAMDGEGMIKLFHGESPNPEVEGLDKEANFYQEIMPYILDACPDGRTVAEHISTVYAAMFVASHQSRIMATMTLQHQEITLDDVIGYSVRSGGKGDPHALCKPTVKRRIDRDMIIRFATSGNPKFALGSDSAPHNMEDKEGPHISCGDYTSPELPQKQTQLFVEQRAVDKLQAFVSDHAANFYGLDSKGVSKYVTVEKQAWTVPREYNGIVPFDAGRELSYQITNIRVV